MIRDCRTAGKAQEDTQRYRSQKEKIDDGDTTDAKSSRRHYLPTRKKIYIIGMICHSPDVSQAERANRSIFRDTKSTIDRSIDRSIERNELATLGGECVSKLDVWMNHDDEPLELCLVRLLRS